MHGIAVTILSVCQMRVLWQNEIIVSQYLSAIRNRDISYLSTPTGGCWELSPSTWNIRRKWPTTVWNTSILTEGVGCACAADQPLQTGVCINGTMGAWATMISQAQLWAFTLCWIFINQTILQLHGLFLLAKHLLVMFTVYHLNFEFAVQCILINYVVNCL